MESQTTSIEAPPRYDMAQFRTGGRMVRFANGQPQLRKDGTPHHAAKNFRTTDPREIMEKLEAAGFTVCRAESLFSHTTHDKGGKSPWRFGIEARFPIDTQTIQHGLNTEYVDRVRILLAHNGRQALRIAPGALRLACTNQFTGAVISINHCNPEIDHFNTDPAAVLFSMRALCGDTVRSIEALHGRPFNQLLVDAIAEAPRLHKAVVRELDNYREDTESGCMSVYTAWSLVQALTATRSPRAIQAAAFILRDVSADRGGRTYDTWRADMAPYFALFSKN